MNKCEIEFESDDVDFLSKKNSVTKEMISMHLLRYGSLIRENEIETVMGVKKEDLPGEKWEFVKLQLREIIKSNGYYVSSRGRDNDLYILLENEMADYNERKNKSAFRALKQRNRALHMIDPSKLGAEEAKKLEFEILRNGSLELEMAQNIKRRCRY